MANYTGGYPGSLNQADVDALTPATIANFASGYTYVYPKSIGTKALGTNPETFEERFQLKSITIQPSTINQDLVEFQSWLRKNKAYVPPS